MLSSCILQEEEEEDVHIDSKVQCKELISFVAF